MLAIVLVLTAGCTSGSHDRPDGPDPSVAGSGCGPVRVPDVRGPRPAYAAGGLDRFANDQAACAAVWLRTGDGFVPQGLAVSGHTAWVSGMDADARVGHRYCSIRSVDLRTGRELARADPVTGHVGARPPVLCRHGGGLALDDHGLWLVETGRLWLLDPDTLGVRRAWSLQPPIRGSFAALDSSGRLGVGGWRPARAGRLFWFATDDLVGGAALDLTADLAESSRRVPRAVQGAVWARLGGHGPTLWFAQSVTRCGVLIGPGRVGRRGLLPGAEGMAPAGEDRVWVVSETGSRYYQRQGGRPVVPSLVQLDLAEVRAWSRPTCTP